MCVRVAWRRLLRHSAAAQAASTQAAYQRAGWLLVLPPAALPPDAGAGRTTVAAAGPVAEQQGQQLASLAAALHSALGPCWAERLVLLWPWRAAAGVAGGCGCGGWPLAAEAGWLGVAPLRLAAALQVQDGPRAKVGARGRPVGSGGRVCAEME